MRNYALAMSEFVIISLAMLMVLNIYEKVYNFPTDTLSRILILLIVTFYTTVKNLFK